jgi:CRISPR-associated protein Cas1
MIKRTVYIGNACTLRKRDMQLIISYPPGEGKDETSLPLEDIGMLIIDNPQISITNALIMSLNENNSAIISCDSSHMPLGLILPMFSNTIFSEKLHAQLQASIPLKKNLWKQTITAKISNQAALLRKEGIDAKKLGFYLKKITSGDAGNVEGRAAAYYWDNLFGSKMFLRHRCGEPPNNLLNYGYAILRAIMARSIIASGLLPSLGIHHRNKYNPYCLSDDLMEPFRPYVDAIVLDIARETPDLEEMTTDIKKKLLQIPVMDIVIEDKISPLMVGIQRTTASLASCYEGESRKILFPVME